MVMSNEQAIAKLDAIGVEDPDRATAEAEQILLDLVAPEVAEAYRRLHDRLPWLPS